MKENKTRNRKVFALWYKGYNKSDIGRKLGISRERIRVILRDYADRYPQALLTK